ncbi:nucleotidyl transferase AbiEii/AbiGii toxin family protein [Paraburkholderia sp. SIMBA_049]
MTQPKELPAGLWESLLPKALTLVDEISKHGGVSNPFFTFGGGTVLMLRYGHRISKDIDFFVSDPQALGYVTPRLSDVADALCDSQYTEASNFVKLHLEAGEIDFVASPNLLPDAHAFETWELFQRPVRVETAAEIVAKKMYHRGNQGSARDLFDLSMVVEREPAALEHARPFMYRHLDVFADALDAPPVAMKERFASIETLNYSPTFEQAADVARTYFAELRAARQRSANEAEAFASDHSLTLRQIDTTRGEYCGPIIHLTEQHAVQGIAHNEAVIHDVEQLGRNAQPGDKLLRIRYQNGQAAVTSVQKPAWTKPL